MLPVSFVVRTTHLTQEQITELREKITQKIARISHRFAHMAHQPHITIQITSRGAHMYELVVRTNIGGKQIEEKSISGNVFTAFELTYDSFRENLYQQAARLTRSGKKAWARTRG